MNEGGDSRSPVCIWHKEGPSDCLYLPTKLRESKKIEGQLGSLPTPTCSSLVPRGSAHELWTHEITLG